MRALQTPPYETLIVALDELVTSGLDGGPIGSATIEPGQLVRGAEEWQGGGGVLQGWPVGFGGDLLEGVLCVVGGGGAGEDVVGVVVDEGVGLD